MANIILLTADTAHASANNTRNALVSGGHSVTLATGASISTAGQLAAFDVVMMMRLSQADAGETAIAAITAAHNAGKPLLVGFPSGNVGAKSDTLAVSFGLLASETTADLQGTTSYAQTLHPVFTTAGIAAPGQYEVASSTGFQSVVPLAIQVGGTPLSNRADTTQTTDINVIFLDKGQARLVSGPAPARAVWCGWIYGTPWAYQAPAIALLNSFVAWLTQPADAGVISGTVKDDEGNPIPDRTVRAYERASGVFVSESTSGPSGAFTIPVQNAEVLHYVIALDELTGEQNARIADRVVPVAT